VGRGQAAVRSAPLKIGGWKPRPVPSLEKVRIIQIASGGYHSLALTGKLM
jgi:hypothetical protein